MIYMCECVRVVFVCDVYVSVRVVWCVCVYEWCEWYVYMSGVVCVCVWYVEW